MPLLFHRGYLHWSTNPNYHHQSPRLKKKSAFQVPQSCSCKIIVRSASTWSGFLTGNNNKKKDGLTPLAANSFDSSRRKQVFLFVCLSVLFVWFTTLSGVRFQAFGHESVHMQRTWWRQRFDTDKLGSSLEQTAGVLVILWLLTEAAVWVLKSGDLYLIHWPQSIQMWTGFLYFKSH